MDRHWLFTWTCYGNWLPGDSRGFVGNVRDTEGEHVIHNVPGTPFDSDMPGLESYVREHMTGPPVKLDFADANALILQYQETARIRRWFLQAASVMFNHTHIVISVPGDPDPKLILESMKSWATRALMKFRPLPPNGEFWTRKGSKRKLRDGRALQAAVIYVVKKQPNPLAVWYAPEWGEVLAEYDLLTTPPE
jgi:REP element-mobilizing transposase RayT